MAKVVDLKELEGLIGKTGGRAGLRKWDKNKMFEAIEKYFKANEKDMKEDKYLIINVEDLKAIVNAGRPENDKWNEPERLTRAGKDWIAWFLTEKIYNIAFDWKDRKKTEFPNIHKQIRASGKKGLVAVPCALIIKALKQKTKSTKTKQKQK